LHFFQHFDHFFGVDSFLILKIIHHRFLKTLLPFFLGLCAFCFHILLIFAYDECKKNGYNPISHWDINHIGDWLHFTIFFFQMGSDRGKAPYVNASNQGHAYQLRRQGVCSLLFTW
jgi:hypothetical protein